jgi:hypothetical protein
MSYDLFFRARSSVVSLTRDKFAGYFGKRKCYELNESQAWYSNDDTGVYFVFEYNEPDSDDDPDEELDDTLLPVSFNLNYFRPHPFGLEAELEVSSFVKEFDLTVSDPQTSGMGDGEYSAEGFLRGWNAGNEFGYRGIVNQDTTALRLAVPADKIETVWRWNYHRETRQCEIGDNIFVPKIFFFNINGQLRTGLAWADGIPILLPEVDLLLVPRKHFARRRLFRSPATDIVVFSWAKLQPILNRFRRVPGEPSCYELFYEETPSDIEQLFRKAIPPTEMPQGVAFDQVLDQELLDDATKTSKL